MRVTKAAERDRGARTPGTLLGDLAALEKNIERVLADIREQKHEVMAGKPVARRKTLKSLPSITALMFACFPPEYADAGLSE